MSWLKNLFRGASGGETKPVTAAREEYKGFEIEAQPYAEGGQFQVAGMILKEIDGTMKQHRFVRADRFASREEAATFCLVKARQIIDQNGVRMFEQG